MVWESIVAGLLVKLGLDKLRLEGFLPQEVYIHEALEALKRDDIDTAVAAYKRGRLRKKASDKSEAAAEIICGYIDVRISKMEAALVELRSALHPPFWTRAFWRLLFSPQERTGLQEQEKQILEGLAILRRKLQEMKDIQ